ncbi:MAG: SusC/RagA family TonB-linked outer membrane protein [Cyclobacteriaceae bacterium]
MKKILLISFMLLSALINESLAQNRTVSGKITSDVDGAGLPGVNVILKGTTDGTTSDIEGNYKLSVPSSGAILVFSFISMTTQEVEVGSRSVIDVTMKEDATQLAEVVVTGSAVGKSKETLSFAVGSISDQMISEVPTTNLGSALQGKVAGLRVNSVGGQPGAGVSFQARGANSLSTGQNPLIIVDGVFLNGGTLADINPEDIERIEVLKGSAGASLYGSQAANGVLQIFTKRGNNVGLGETTVTYRGEVGVSQLTRDRFPTATTHPYELDAQGNFVFDANGTRPLDADKLGDNPWPNYQDYQKQIFRNGSFSTHSLTMQGRSSSTNFLLSGQRAADRGVIEGVDGFVRNSFRLNVDHALSDKMDLSVSSMYSASTQDRLPENGTGALINNILFYPPFYDLSTPNEEDGSLYNWDIDSLGSEIRNPLYTLYNRETTQDRNRVLGTIKLNYDINDWLSVNGSASIDRSDNQFEEFIVKGFLSDDLRGGVQFDPTSPANGAGGGLERSNFIREGAVVRLNAIAVKQFGDFNMAMRLSYLYEDNSIRFNSTRGDDLAVAGIRSFDNISDQNSIRIQSYGEDIVARSYFAIADIDYQKKYIFSGLVRREGSSLFGPDERWSNYFRASGAYRITQDVDIPGFQELKVRASYGTAGIRPTFEQRFETFSLQNGSASPGTLGNDKLKPARSGELEVGLNARILDIFSLEFNYAKTKTVDQILNVPLPAAVGFSGRWSNAGTIEAKSIELSLGTDIFKSKDLSWNMLINFDKTSQKLTQLNVPPYLTGPGNQQSTIFRIEEGVSFGSMYGQMFARSLADVTAMGNAGVIDPTTDAPYDASNYTVNQVGYVVGSALAGTPDEVPVKILDVEGNPVVDKIGDINPDFRMGIANTFSYKNFSVYALLDWKKGGDIYNQTRTWLFRDAIHQDVGNYPISVDFWSGLYNTNIPNSSAVEDGSFLMMREMSISYSFDKTQLATLFGGFMKGVKVAFIGRNLFTITDYSGFHPDITSAPQSENQLSSRLQDGVGSNVNNPGGDPNLFFFDSFSYPKTRTFTGSVTITF